MKRTLQEKNEFFERQLAKQISLKNILFSVLTGTVSFLAQNLIQVLMLKGEWFADLYELIVEVGLSIFMAIILFFILNWTRKKTKKKIAEELHGEAFIMANYAITADQQHYYRGIMYLTYDALYFKGRLYSKPKNIEFKLDDLAKVSTKKILWQARGLEIVTKSGVVWNFKTEGMDIWEEAIQYQMKRN